MIKIKILSPSESDVLKMEVRGWTVKITHDNGNERDVVFIIKGRIKFRLTAYWKSPTATLEKVIDGEVVDVKSTTTFSQGIVGTIFINDHSDPDKCYAFFRTRKIVDLMDKHEIYKVTFAEPSANGFIKDYFFDDKGGPCRIITDGEINRVMEDGIKPAFQVRNATWIYSPNSELTILSEIKPETIEEIDSDLR